MDKVKILILEPDHRARKEIANSIKRHVYDDAEVVMATASIEDVMTSVWSLEPHLIILGAYFYDKSVSLMLGSLQLQGCRVAFLTKEILNEEDFLIQPLAILHRPFPVAQLKDLIKLMKSKTSNQESLSKITVTDSKGVHVFRIDEIMYCVGERNYTTFQLENGEQIMVSKTLKFFDDQLSSNDFFRAHKSNLINLNHVKMIMHEDGGIVRMRDHRELPVSRAKKKELFRRITGT